MVMGLGRKRRGERDGSWRLGLGNIGLGIGSLGLGLGAGLVDSF